MPTQTIRYSSGDHEFDAVVVTPPANTPVAAATPATRPAVMVCHAWGGRSSFDEDKAHALAELGYVGVAVDVYGLGKRGSSVEECSALMTPLLENPAELRNRLTASFEAVRNVSGVDADRVGVIGFCFGGHCALLMARMGLNLRAAVSIHGLLKVGTKLESKPRARMLVLHGQDDPMVPAEDIKLWVEEMQRVGGDWQLQVYPGAKHAFTVPGAHDDKLGIKHHPGAEQRSWQHMQAFLEQTM